MSTNPVVPSNWIYSSRQFSMHSDALSENIAIYRPIKETFSSKSPGNAIKIVVDSNSSFLRPQRSYFSATVSVKNADGSPVTNAEVSQIGAMACFRTMNVKFGGKVVDEIEDVPAFVADTYQTVEAEKRKYLRYNEGAGNADTFKNSSGSFTFKHHIMAGSFRPLNGNPIPLAILPNQSVEITLTLNNPQQAFTNLPNGAYFEVSNIRYVAQVVTPSAEYMSALWSGIRAGKYLEMDVVGVSQLSNPCSGASQNNFILPLTNGRVVGLTHRFRDDNKAATTTGDKSLIYDTANLRSWRYQIGQYRLPLTEDFQVEDTVMVGDLSMNDNSSYSGEDLDLDNFYSKQFVMRYSWQSRDEDASSALNLLGGTGNVHLITTHNLPAPSTNVSLQTTVYAQKTILIGATVDVV